MVYYGLGLNIGSLSRDWMLLLLLLLLMLMVMMMSFPGLWLAWFTIGWA